MATSDGIPAVSHVPTPNRISHGRGWTIWIVLAAVLAAAHPVLLHVALWRGQTAIENREHSRALSWLKVARVLAPNRAEVHYLLARCNRRLNRMDDVKTHLQRAFDLGWNVRQLEREQWLALAQTGRYEDVKPHWSELFSTAGSDGPEISKSYVTACLTLLRINDAVRVLAAWEQDFPADAEPHILRGKLHECLLRWPEAEQSYGRALQFQPEQTDARLGLARALMKQIHYEEAVPHLQQIVANGAENAEAAVGLAECWMKLGRLGDGRRILEGVLGKHPDDVEALRVTGDLELADRQPAAALKHLEQAVKLSPEDVGIRYSYAKSLQAVGRKDEAQREFAFVDQSTKPLIRLSRLMSKLLAEPENVELRFEVASITWEYKSREEGARWFQSLLEIAPDYQPAHAALARHYALIGFER